MNQKDGKYFDDSLIIEKKKNQLTKCLKKEDLEWLGFNWLRFRIGLLTLKA